MKKADLVRKVYEAHGGLTQAEAAGIVDQVMLLVTEGLCKDGHLLISGFGTFKVVERKARTGRDLGRGKPIAIPGYRTVVFVPSRKWALRSKS